MPRICLFLSLSLLVSVPAWGNDRLTQAKTRFSRGETHYRLGNFSQALKEYQAALRLTHRPSIIFNIAQCHRQLNNNPKALFYYKLYLSDWERQRPGISPPYRNEVRSHITRLSRLARGTKERQAPSSGTLRFQGLPEGASVFIDGQLRARSPVDSPIRLDAARYRVTVELEGAIPWERRITIRRGAETRVVVDMEMETVTRSKTWLGLGISTAVLAVGAEITALVFTVKAADQYEDTPEYATSQNVAIAGHVGAGVFAVASAVSFVLYYFSGQDTDSAITAIRVSPFPGGGMISGGFRF